MNNIALSGRLPGCGKATTTRVRGFAEWRPRPDAQTLLRQVRKVLDEYHEHLPLTLRQVYYRLVGTRGYPKDEKAYKRLGELLNRARRAGLVAFEDIRDDGVTARPAPGWSSTGEFLTWVRAHAAEFRLDRQRGQARRLLLMCEAAGMVPQLERVAHPYGVEVKSSGGFDSTTAKHALACEVARCGGSTEILHLGDLDPSGVHVFQSLAEDVAAFARELGAAVLFTRLAVTPAQAVTLRLPTAPAKASDGRSFAGIGDDPTATVQAEAIPPDVLAKIVDEAIRQRLDRDAYARVLEAENEARGELTALLSALGSAGR